MKTYESMKLISIKWLGMIPKHWEVIKNKHFLSERDEKTAIGNEELLSLSQYTGISIKGQKADKTGMHEAESLVGYKVVHKNDIVMNIMLAWNGSTAKSKYNGIISPAYAVYHVMDNSISPDYLHYLFKTPQYMRYFETFSTGIIKSRLRLYPQSFLHLFTIIPPREEQDQIVRFLDWKVSEINRLINIKRKEIERIEELKKAVVSHAVTQGLDSTVTMKSSGVNWLGDIPAHWELSKVKHQFYIENGSDPVIDGDIPVYGSGADSFKTCGEYKCGPTVLLGRKGATLHIPHYITGCYWNVDTAFNTVAKPYCKVSMLFFYFLATLFDYNFYKTQTTLPSMTQFNYKNIIIPVPPLTEQENILKFLEQELSKYDGIISNKNKEIKCLNEFKIRLISDVVTGKIDVRGIEIPEYQYTEEVNDIVDVDDQEESNEQED